MEATIKIKSDVKIKEIPISDKCKIAILVGGFDSQHPSLVMNNAVKQYVGDTKHNTFVESGLDTPWLRIIIKGINDLDYKEFKNQTL